MSAEFDPRDEPDLLAAEYVLGLLHGEALLHVQGRVATDPDFNEAVQRWERRLSPLTEGFDGVAPPPELWSRIEARLAAEPKERDNVVPLRPSQPRWLKGYAAAMTAVAASLALVLVSRGTEPDPPVIPTPPVEAPQPVLVASLASEDGAAAVAVAYEPARRSLIVTPARLGIAAGQSHELWLIPAGGTPVSLGLVQGGEPQRLSLASELSNAVRPEATIALSVEPAGGSPTGLPTGPVIASGPLRGI